MFGQASERLSRYALIGAIALASAVAIGSFVAWLPPFVSNLVRGFADGILGGNDFAMYYTASALGSSGQWVEAYSLEGLAAAMDLRVGAASFAYPPMLAQALHPLTWVSYPTGLAVWFSLSILAVLSVISVFGRRGLIAIGAMGFPLYVALRFGQFAPIALGVLAVAAFYLRRGRPFLAGVAIGLLVVKPQLLVGPILISLLDREARPLLRGMLTSALTVSIVSVAVSPAAWPAFLTGLSETARPDVSSRWDYSLLDLIASLPTWALLITYGAIASALLSVSLSAARSTHDLEIKMALGLALSLVLSPRMIVYDWSLLIIAGAWLTPALATNPSARWAVALVVIGSVSGHATSPINVGWIALAVAILLVSKAIRSPEPAIAAPSPA